MVFTTEKTASLTFQIVQLCAGFCLVYVVIKSTQLYFKRQKLLKTLEGFPGPPSHWLYGNIHQDLNMMEKWAEKFPYAFPRWFGGFVPAVVITHPDYAKTLFSRNGNLLLFVPIGRGLLVLNGPKWHQQRRLLTPAFHYDILKPYVAQIADSVKVMLDKWEKLIAEDPTKSLEMFDHVSLMTLDSIMKCAFSYKSSCQTDKHRHSSGVREPHHVTDYVQRGLPVGARREWCRGWSQLCKSSFIHCLMLKIGSVGIQANLPESI
uniref:Cytochrome P450 family 4 subfamily B member 1 n=1 Tax=Podarcis muralis TaxID=64176 RepID=A0A670IKA7_PODMU